MLNIIYKTTAACTFMVSTMCIASDEISPIITPSPTTSNTESFKIFDPRVFVVDARVEQPESVKDPLQSLNRKIYIFNDTIDRNVLRPAAVIYADTIPVPAQSAYSNFRSNLKEPWNAVNQLLQGKPIRSVKTLGRFTLNTVTSLGFADTAKHFNLVNEDESFGTTLGVWGVPSGPYLVLPFFGSSSIRDGIGLVPDAIARPYSRALDPDELVWANLALEATAIRAQYLTVDSMVQGDKYATLRDVYLQQNAFKIAQKRGEDISQNMFMEDSFDEDENFINEDEELPIESE